MSDNTDDIIDRNPVTDTAADSDDSADTVSDDDQGETATVPETTVPNAVNDTGENEIGHVVASE